MKTASWPYPFWIAHRGAGRLAPENTFAAFRLGAHYGYRMFECDVQLSSDNVLFLLHDATLERTTNGRGLASDQPWSSLSKLDAGRWHSPAYTAEPLANLQTIARYCLEQGYFLNLEIKPAPGLEIRTGAAVAHAVAQWWPAGSVPPLLTSFQTEALAAAQQAQPHLPRGLLLDKWRTDGLAAAEQLACVALVCDYKLWNTARIGQAKQKGLRTLSYTVNTRETVDHLVKLGIDGVITDKVDVFRPEPPLDPKAQRKNP